PLPLLGSQLGVLSNRISRHEPFCSVLPEQVSESSGIQKGSLPSAPVVLNKAAISKRLRFVKPHIVRAGPRRSHVSRDEDRVGWNRLRTSNDWNAEARLPAEPRRI